MGDEDPLPAVRAGAIPRYSYRELEQAAEMLEDEFKQIASCAPSWTAKSSERDAW
jgi:hypothetical protein